MKRQLNRMFRVEKWETHVKCLNESRIYLKLFYMFSHYNLYHNVFVIYKSFVLYIIPISLKIFKENKDKIICFANK